MLTETCRIVAVDDNNMWLESMPKSACQACAAGKGCGGGVLAKAFARKTIRFQLPRSQSVQVNQYWQVAIPERLLVTASLLTYAVPLVLMLLVAILGGFVLAQEQEWLVAILSLLALVSGVKLARFIAGKRLLINAITLIKPNTAGHCSAQSHFDTF